MALSIESLVEHQAEITREDPVEESRGKILQFPKPDPVSLIDFKVCDRIKDVNINFEWFLNAVALQIPENKHLIDIMSHTLQQDWARRGETASSEKVLNQAVTYWKADLDPAKRQTLLRGFLDRFHTDLF